MRYRHPPSYSSRGRRADPASLSCAEARDRHRVRCVPTRFARRSTCRSICARGGLSVVAGAHRVLVVVQRDPRHRPAHGRRRGQRTVTGPLISVPLGDLDGRRDAGRAAVVGSVTYLPYPAPGRTGARYSSANASHLLGETSPPSPAVPSAMWITWKTRSAAAAAKGH